MTNVPAPCQSCRFRINDGLEGHLCLRVPQIITLADGSTVNWPGQPVARAFEFCQGDARKPRLFGRLRYWMGL